jgi:membrane-bound lytic murein transglycosylase B
MPRRVLPQRRYAETFDLRHRTETGDQSYSISVGYFADDLTPAEIFINGAKVGSGVEAVARDGAVLMSIALQYGVPLDVMRGAITRERGDAPSSIVGAVLDLLAHHQGRKSDHDEGVQSHR